MVPPATAVAGAVSVPSARSARGWAARETAGAAARAASPASQTQVVALARIPIALASGATLFAQRRRKQARAAEPGVVQPEAEQLRTRRRQSLPAPASSPRTTSPLEFT